ncbi:division/cell wall cluster transcriptional repressor MraZ [Candidatus Uhrbacteria bacterium]|nr:division/cell wall cluster transcriptional repressor MraZ [Candidatus Uhrbacteria bacterium]
MFIGEYNHTVDDKGRLAIPVKFRNSFPEGAVVTKGLDECLFVYPRSEWEKLAEKLARLPISQSNTRAFSRLMLAGAMDLEIDKQGRVILPEYLRQYGGLVRKVIITGLYNRLEIWDEEKWKVYKSGTEKSSGQIAEGLKELGV